VLGDNVLDLEELGQWAHHEQVAMPDLTAAAPPGGPQASGGLPATMLGLLRLEDAGMAAVRSALAAATGARGEDLAAHAGLVCPLNRVQLRTPVPNPPTIRDFYAFEQHVKSARALRGLEMIPEWYEIAVFYFSNTAALFGAEEPVPYPRASHELDFELEMAAVIGRAGSDIAAEDGPSYIAGYMVMNDWSARDLQRHEMKLNLGPAKGKDFATSLGPWLVTPDELEDRRIGSGKDERFDLAMTGRINGDQLTSANFRDITFTFPQMIERASQGVQLRPGDVLGSGTCGTGCILELGTARHRWLLAGDVVEMEIERLGLLRNTVTDSTKGSR
jgi:fumarylacetoacetate (FAA) hydrolase